MIKVTLEAMVAEVAISIWTDTVEAELGTKFHSLLWDLSDHSTPIELVSNLRSRISRFLAEATNWVSPTELEQTYRNRYMRFMNGMAGGCAAEDPGSYCAGRSRSSFAWQNRKRYS